VRRDQWIVLFVAWLGWVFDAMDATIYAIVLHPALHELLHTSSGPPTADGIGWYGGIIFSIFLIGWAIGGITFGILADRFGRTKVLMATILIYAVFSGPITGMVASRALPLSHGTGNRRRVGRGGGPCR
jgi:MFS family permease